MMGNTPYPTSKILDAITRKSHMMTDVSRISFEHISSQFSNDYWSSLSYQDPNLEI